MDELQEIRNFLVEAQEKGLRDLNQEQLDQLAAHNVQLIVVRNTAEHFHFILPDEGDVSAEVNDEDLGGINAAKASDCAGTLATGATASTSACFPSCASTLFSVGCLGTASTASSGQTAENSLIHIEAGLQEALDAKYATTETTDNMPK